MINNVYTTEENEYIRQNYATMRVKDIAKNLGRTANAVQGRAARMGLRKYKPQKPGGRAGQNQDDKAAYIPTREEIDAACQKIQDDWTPEDRRRRLGNPSQEPYTIPVYVIRNQRGELYFEEENSGCR